MIYYQSQLTMPRAYLELLRPANVVTALADVLAGFAIAGLRHPETLPWLLLSSCCLYAGGVVLNDVFDRDLDRIERPERPIPSGRVSTRSAATLGGGAARCRCRGRRDAPRRRRAAMALAIAAAVLLYDAWGKRQAPIAPLNMALCRALNLMLGVAAVPAALADGLADGRRAAALHLRDHRAEPGRGPRRLGTGGLVRFDNLDGLDRRPRAGDRRAAGSRRFPALVLAAALRLAGRAGVRRGAAPPDARRRSGRPSSAASCRWSWSTPRSAPPSPGRSIAAAILATGLVAGWLARMFAVT